MKLIQTLSVLLLAATTAHASLYISGGVNTLPSDNTAGVQTTFAAGGAGDWTSSASVSGSSFQPLGAGATSFESRIPAGNATISFAGTGNGGGVSSASGNWNLGIQPVPEPANLALAIFAGLFATGLVIRAIRSRGARVTLAKS